MTHATTFSHDSRPLTQDLAEQPKLLILGTRGIPAQHGGFETFAQRLAIFLIKKGWSVVVYCQNEHIYKTQIKRWNGIDLVQIPARGKNKALASILFDLKSCLHASKQKNSIVLTLGYNTALFSILYRLKDMTNVINMDGIEWRRQKWNGVQKLWLRLNEVSGTILGNHLIADHPEIKKYLMRKTSEKKITTIAYGSDRMSILSDAVVAQYGLKSKQYVLIIARPEPENSILEIVSAYSSQKRGFKLVILGNYRSQNPYHRKVSIAASDEVVFLGAIYDKEIVDALRVHARLYVHGHQVGGTNPSLVEALSAGSPVLAHNNVFNQWVAGNKAHYFNDMKDCQVEFSQLLKDELELDKMGKASLAQYDHYFSADMDLVAYEELLSRFVKKSSKKQREYLCR